MPIIAKIPEGREGVLVVFLAAFWRGDRVSTSTVRT